MAALIFVGAIIWGALSAQFLVQAITSLVIAVIYLSGLVFSKVSKSLNAMASLVSIAQTLFFAALFYGGNWISSYFMDYDSWNWTAIVSLVSFLATIVDCGFQV